MKQLFVTNRHEIKYLANVKEAETFCNSIADLLIADPQNDGRGYLNHSFYFDSPEFIFYNQQIDGLATRSKPRLRTYRPDLNAAPLAIFLEIKYCDNNVIAKERTPLTSAQANTILKGEKVSVEPQNKNNGVLDKFTEMVERKNLETSIGILYRRMAFSCSTQTDLRITLDTQIQFTDCINLTPPLTELRSIAPSARAIIELKYQTTVPNRILDAAKFMNFDEADYSKYTDGIKQFYGT